MTLQPARLSNAIPSATSGRKWKSSQRVTYSPSPALRLITPSRSRNAALFIKQLLLHDLRDHLTDQNVALLKYARSRRSAHKCSSPGLPGFLFFLRFFRSAQSCVSLFLSRWPTSAECFGGISAAPSPSYSLGTVSHAEIDTIWMLKDQRAHAGLRIHHEPLGQLHSNVFRLQDLPDAGLIFQIWASRVAKAVPFAAITRCESLRHGNVRGIREAPVFANSPVQPFRAGFCRFNRQRLQSMLLEVVPFILGLFAALAHSFSCGDHEYRHVITLSILRREHVIA